MSISIINKVKYNKNIYQVYSWIGSLLINNAKWFVKKDESLIVFVSFGGRKFDDSPRAIYDLMVADKRFDNYRLVWAFINPEKFTLERGGKVKIDTLKYYKLLLKASVWVTNSSVERGLHFKARKCLYINTWHGTPIKVMGSNIASSNASFGDKKKRNGKSCPYDVFLAQGEYDADVFSEAFGIPRDRIKIIGLPRNDSLANGNDPLLKEPIRKKLNIPVDKKVVLYVPTFRDYEKKDGKYLILTPPIDLNKWKKCLGEEYILLFRAHPSIVEVMNVNNNDNFVINVSDYPVLNELMLVYDMMISDYSSILFDYSILGRPMFSFAYDYEAYTKGRGVYFDIRQALECIGLDNEEKLLDAVKNIDYKERMAIAVAFRDKYVQYYGNATEKAVNIIYDRINDN